jgi:hypothetical protein
MTRLNSAPKPIVRRAFVFGGGTSMVRMAAQCNRDTDPAPVGHEQVVNASPSDGIDTDSLTLQTRTGSSPLLVRTAQASSARTSTDQLAQGIYKG